MFIKLNSKLKQALGEVKEIADDNGYFSVTDERNNRQYMDELTRLGYIRKISDWTGFESIPTHFVLESKAYFYDNDEADYERQLSMQDTNNIINITGSNNVVQQYASDSDIVILNKTDNDNNKAQSDLIAEVTGKKRFRINIVIAIAIALISISITLFVWLCPR